MPAAIQMLVPAGSAVPILSTLLVVVLNIGLYWLAFRVMTPGEVASRDLVTGAIVGGVAWSALQAIGSLLVARQLRHTSELYGTFGVVLGLLFFLYLESRGFLPLSSPSYRPHSAAQLLEDARAEAEGFDPRATALWARYTHDGRIVSCGRDNQVVVWDGSGSKQKAMQYSGELPLRAIFSHSGERVFAGDFTGHVYAWNTDGTTVSGFPVRINPAYSEPDLGTRQNLADAPNDRLGLEWN